ncbi:MAG: hypothetical protein JXJ04_14695 [Spirochaetales bacterium]|nr:hypothetical protein [Spirochaetales bacterium]
MPDVASMEGVYFVKAGKLEGVYEYDSFIRIIGLSRKNEGVRGGTITDDEDS